MSRRRINPLDPKKVTFRRDGATDHGTVDCSWEKEPRQQPITEAAARKFAEGWQAEFSVEAAW